MPQSPKTTGFMQTTPTIKSEMDAKQCLSANSTNNNNTIFNFPTVQSSSNGGTSKVTSNQINMSNQQHMADDVAKRSNLSHEGKSLDVNDLSVNNVNVASSNHLSTSCCPNSSSMSSSSNTSSTTTNNLQKSNLTNCLVTKSMNSNNNISTINTQSTSSSSSSCNNINVISVCDGIGDDVINPHNGIIIADEGTSYYDAIKLEENGTTAIIYETIVIENPTTSHQDILLSTANHNTNTNNDCSKFVTNKNHAVQDNNKIASAAASSGGGGGIIVLTGSLNDLLLSNQNGAGQCLNDVVKSQIQSIVLNLNSSAPAVNTSTGTISGSSNHHQQQQSIMVSINSNHQVNL